MDIRTLCLGILTLGEASGYEIKQAFEEHFSRFYEASFGSIYPALAKLTDDGMVTCTEQPQDRRPDKKVYRITASGRLEFIDELMKPPGRDRLRSEFIATLMFADLLPTRHLAELLDERIHDCRDAVAEWRAREAKGKLTPGQRFVLGYAIAMHESMARYIEENRHLIEGHALLAPSSAG
jgi:DNA-binding PadR family transcriptional regulator